ncbi:MAG: 1-deoxy-D-xylulose-5-phosphate synthase [Ruminococcaceae bacterium]|nr:1-deoxy-D-xylulose-5-phosphate synthase [Oscillospiraceae bacterium]
MVLNNNINHEVISNMTVPQLKALCKELRGCILRTVMKNGGHLSSNLGTVELAVAIHYVYDVFGGDKVIWDVGHQAYAHKLLTGRHSRFDTLRKKDGVSGFTRRAESPADAFISGHSSTSISAAYGISTAMRLKGEDGAVAAVIGDGALTGGMAYEGLNNAGKTASSLTLILNDNAMSISKSTGALARYLAQIRSTRKYYCAKERVKSALSSVPLVGRSLERAVAATKTLVKEALYDSSNLFENLGFAYIGPVDGHNIEDLTEALSVAKLMKRPCVVHVFTRKGRGYKPAEENPGEYHAVAKNGVVEEFVYDNVPHSDGSFSEAFGRELERLGKEDSRICAITAAMKYAVGLNYFKNSCAPRFFDTGIAEQHSVTFAAGLAVQGMLPVFAVYSTFLQRGFDQMIHDCAIEKTHITLCIDRAGFVGADGETHQGIFDVPMLRAIPNTVIYCPATYEELRRCLSEAIYRTEGIACVRYPKGEEPDIMGKHFNSAFDPVCSYYYSGKRSDVLGITYGRIASDLANACEKTGADMLRLVTVEPFPQGIFNIAFGYKKIVFFEEGSVRGGAAEGFLAELAWRGYRGKAECVGVADGFVPAATVEEQLAMYGLNEECMTEILRS